mgnify:CR=1 FL=1
MNNGNRLCSNAELGNLFKNTKKYQLTYSGAFIPSCETGSNDCSELEGDYVTASD